MTTSTLHEDVDFLAFGDVFVDVGRFTSGVYVGVHLKACTSTPPRTVHVLVQGARVHARKSNDHLPGTGTLVIACWVLPSKGLQLYRDVINRLT